jgi:hypothetical protein
MTAKAHPFIGKSCPFCGSPELFMVTTFGQGEPHKVPNKTFVICQECGATGPHVSSDHVWGVENVTIDIQIRAGAHWNTRK